MLALRSPWRRRDPNVPKITNEFFEKNLKNKK
jgi:hypothetical protein